MQLRTTIRSLRSILVIVGLLASAPGLAAPNYYSKGGTSNTEARLTVIAPKAGKVEPGGTLTVSWTKQSDGTEVNVWLFTASSDGLRGDKVRGLVAPKAAAATFTPRAGSFDWVVPEDLPKGRYLVVVNSGLDEATSAPFVVTESPIKLTAPRTEAAGTVKAVTLDGKGKGSVRLVTNDRELEFSWGSGQCPSLLGALPGALAVLSGLGGVSIVPVVRDVTRRDKVEQTCLDGFVVLAPGASPAPSSAP
jgi:hypothetical protein